MKSFISLLVFTICLNAGTVQAAEKTGVILMHGKGGTSRPKSPVGRLALFLEKNGFLISAPDMPWSRNRGYDRTFEQSMQEIDAEVEKLMDKGVSKVVVGGHSLGANAALGYGARSDRIAGILAIAPGHLPESEDFQNYIGHDWKRAKQMVESGSGDQKAKFSDLNQGRKSTRNIKAKVYLSWFDPNGPAVMPVNTANLKPGVSLLWIIGEGDRMHLLGEAYAFGRAPLNQKNAYIIVKGGHKDTPENGKVEILRWLKDL
jgi:pimeloyl-ACP methyl ester carboxylesterase